MPTTGGPRFTVEIVGSGGSATFPAAAALGDNTANPTLSGIGTYPHWFDGATWDRARGDSTNGLLVNTELSAAAALADTTANPTVPGVGTFGLVWNGTTWDRLAGTTSTVGKVQVASAGTTSASDTATAGEYSGPFLATGVAQRGWNTAMQAWNGSANWERVRTANGANGTTGTGVLGMVKMSKNQAGNYVVDQTITGTQANAWNASALTITSTSTAVDLEHYNLVTVFGATSSVTGTWNLSIQVSQDNTNWYGGEEIQEGITSSNSGDFEFTQVCAARYVRLRMEEAVAGGATITATISGKRG